MDILISLSVVHNESTQLEHRAFTEKYVGKFFEVLKSELKKLNFKQSRIFNVDETGITIIQHSSEKVR